MKWVFNAVYAGIFLGFLRKILAKVTEDFGEGNIPFYKVDSEGCYCICFLDYCLGYSYDLEDARKAVRRLVEAIPRFSGRMRLVEDNDMNIADWRDIPGVSEDEMHVFRSVL